MFNTLYMPSVLLIFTAPLEFILPVTLAVPLVIVPVELTVSTLDVPATLTVTLELAFTTTLLVPELIELACTLRTKVKLVVPITIGSFVVSFHWVSA